MDGELPPWNKHGSHNSRIPYNTAGEHQEGHDDMIGDSFAAGEQMTSLSSCMSGAFKALLPDYHGTSSAMSANSDKYSYSPDNHCLIKPGTAVDKKSAVESDFLKDPLGEASASVTHILPLRCAQYVRHEKNRELDQGNGNWTSVIKDALEMSNGMEMEQTLSMDECGPLMNYNLIYKGPETEANFRLKDHFNLQIAGSKLNEKQDGQGVKEEPDSFISMLSDDISKNKDVLEMVGEASILDVGSSLGKEELGITGIREHEPGLLPGFTRSSYTPFSSSESLTKSEQFPGIQCGLSCKDVSLRKTASTNTGFKHAKVNNETVPESSTVYGLHHLALQKGCHQAEITDGKTSVNSQDHSSQHNVQDERVKTSKLHVSESTVIKQSAAYLPNTQYFGSKLKKQVHDLVPTPASVGSQNTAVVKCENIELRIPTEERISESSLSVPGKNETNDFQETSIGTKNAKLSLKVETKFAPEIQNSSSGSETVPNLPVLPHIIHTDYKCKDSQIEPSESGKLNELCFQENNSKNVTLTLPSTSAFTERTRDECDIHVQQKQTQTSLSTVLLPFNENFKNSERSEKVFLNINSESSIPPFTENIQEAPPSPTSRTDCSSQHNLQKASQRHKKARKREKSELEALSGPIHKSNKRDNSSVYGSEILESVDKLDTARYEETNQNVSLADNDSTAPKEEDLITNGDVNPPTPRKKCRMAQLELVADTAETPQKTDHSCSEASQEEVPSNSRINRKAISRKKLKKKTRLKAKNSATLSLSQSTVLSPEEDCTSHFQVSDTTPMKGVSNPTVTQQSNAPTTFSEPKEDFVDVKRHQKMRRFPIKASKGKHKNATRFLNRQSSLEPQTDSVSTSVTESSNIVCPQNSPNKSKQKKRAYIHKAAKTPNVCPQEDMENVMTSKTKIVKAKRPLKKAARKDNNETTLLDTQSSIATVKQMDSVSNVGNEVESPVILSTPRKSQKKKLSDMCVLNPLSETDVSIVQPTTKRFRTKKTLDKKVSHNTVGENCEPAHLALSSVDSVYATETDYSGISQQSTEKTSNKRRKTDIKFIEAQTSTTSQQDDVTLPPSEDFSSIVVSNPKETVKVKGISRNKTNDNLLNEMNVHCEVCCQSSGEEKICSASLTEIMQGVTQTYPLKCTSSRSPTSTGFQLDSQTTTSSEQLSQLPQLVDVEPTQTRDTDLSKLPKTYPAHSPIKLPNAKSPTRSDVNCTSPSSSLECIEITQSFWKCKCSRCGQRFERYRTLSAHLQTHAPGFRYTCAQCGQFFERWSKLWLHQQQHRLKSRCYSCTQCNLQFNFFNSFREHMIDHAGQRPYACPLCPKTFIQEASLHAHQCESHKLCKSLKCDVCSKTFSSLRNLIKHSLLHNGSTSHVCLLCNLSFTNTRVLKEHLKTHTTYYGPALPDIPSKPLDFPHKCKRCKASFSTGELLYAHQIRHSRDAKTHIRPAVVPTSKLFDSCHNDTPSTPPFTRRNHISNLKLDGIPNNNSLYVYSHPDRLYVPPSGRVQLPVINLDPDEPEDVSDSQNPGHELPNSEITSQSDSTHLPQATLDHETTNLNSSESIEMMANSQHNYSRKYQRSPSFVETSVDMEIETPAQEEDSSESFECADCTEKLTSVLGLYEHYILHAIGDAYVQVN
uniref:C2H2-type domain-containing protein n=1 Tax=Sinocyclocheilus anshuiensis TaxID=1608454 RepID=A0A671LTV8_9TELE